MKSTNLSEGKEIQIPERSTEARLNTSTKADAREYFSKNRLETFSDAIFAIIITLLVLEIHIPELSSSDMNRELLTSLIDILPNLLALAVSFLTISVIWINHHRVFTLTKTILITHKAPQPLRTAPGKACTRRRHWQSAPSLPPS
ncbi:MAG: TMEM175 family protein [Cyanobium sp.]